jgi:hypothetical protein
MMRLAANKPFSDNPGFASFGAFAGISSRMPRKPKPIASMAWGYLGKTNSGQREGAASPPALSPNTSASGVVG